MLIAQTQAEGTPVVTNETAFDAYGVTPVVIPAMWVALLCRNGAPALSFRSVQLPEFVDQMDIRPLRLARAQC